MSSDFEQVKSRVCQPKGAYVTMRPLASSWEQRKLGEVATRHDNLRIPITAKDRIPGDTPYYGANGIQDYVEGYTHEGEFVLVAEDGATDLDNYPVQLISGLSWVNNHAHVIKAIPDVAQNRFIMYLIKSMDIASYLVGGTRSKLNAEVLMGIELKLPSNSEQIYIGALLSTLDSLITLHQRKCQYRGLYGYLSWEQRKLGEVAPLQRGFDLPVNQMMPGPYPVVMSNGIGGWHSKYMVKGPGVVTGRSGTIGSLHYIEQNFWPHNTSLWVTSFNGNEPRFIYWLYASIGVERFGSGSGVPTLNRNDVHDLRVGFPCDVAEQRRIGTFFSCLDGLITLHQ